MLSTNARAEASQVCLAANSRQACGEIARADRQAARKSAFNAPTGAAPITSRGPVTGNAATGRPLASAPRSTKPKESVCGIRSLRQDFALPHAQQHCLRI